MSHSEEELANLLNDAYSMPYGAARIALVEQIIAHADAGHFDELSFYARVQATDAYVYGGEPARSFVTFSWSLAEFDRDPVRHARMQHTLMWQFKATVTGLTEFDEIPLDRTYAVLDEMQRRWQLGGHSLHAVHQHRHFVARHVGDLTAADEHYRQWVNAPRDDLSDCLGCDPSSKAYWLASRGRDEEAVALAEPVLAGRLTCSEQPQGVLTALLKPYLRTGRLDQARDAHRRGYRLHRSNVADLHDIAEHIEFCALTGNSARGVEILERHLGWLDKPPSPFAAMWFAAAGALVLERAVAAGGHNLVLRRPAYGDRPAGPVRAQALAEELTGFALRTAQRFDARNGTDFQGGRLREALAAPSLVDHLSLSPTGPKRPAPPPVTRPAPQVDLPVGGGIDDLLELAEDHLRRGRRAESSAVYEAFDDRYAGAELTVLQRGRRADAYGVDAATRGEMAEAEAAWRSAMDLFGQAGDELRRQSTRGRVGRLMCGSGRGEQGLEWVEESVSYVLAHAGPPRWGGALYSLAVAYGDVGRIEDGLATLDRAEEHIGANLDPTLPAVICIARSQFLGVLDRMDEARESAQQALRRSRELDFSEGIAHGGFLAGLAAERLGETDAAVAAYDEAIGATDDDTLVRRIRAQRAGLLAGSSRASEVIGDLEEAVAEAVAEADDENAARARHGLAIAYLNAGRALDSAETAEEALAWFVAQQAGAEVDPSDAHADHVAAEAAHHVLAIRHLLAAGYNRLGQPDEAIAQLELIAAACAEDANPAGVGQMNEEIGDVLDRQDRDAAAALRYLTAAEAFRAAELPIEEFRNRRQHATSLMWADDLPAAMEALAAADQMSLSLPPDEQARWERASLLYDGARILRSGGRLGEATVRAEGAAGAFRAIGLLVQSAHAEMVHAELLLSSDRPVEAEAAARRGLADLPEDVDGRDRLEGLLAAAVRAQGRAAD
jgi:tetratricopeptide (TPR) repeat protein